MVMRFEKLMNGSPGARPIRPYYWGDKIVAKTRLGGKIEKDFPAPAFQVLTQDNQSISGPCSQLVPVHHSHPALITFSAVYEI